ncbi:MAG: hypothetical protein Q9194_000978 [Teloschistes cf. exilis]
MAVAQYALDHGLSRDHLAINPLDLLPLPDDTIAEQDNDDDWKMLQAAAASPPPEPLVAVKEALVFLAATNAHQYEGYQFEGHDVTPTYRDRKGKLELPLLRTDHEADMVSFVHKIEPNLAHEFIPAETVDDELDEGLGWPSYCQVLPDKVFQDVQNEKLEVDKDVLAYMIAALDTREKGKVPTFEYEWPRYRRNDSFDPVTPPLLPRSPSPQSFEPSSGTGHLDLWTDVSSPTRQELEDIDNLLFKKDGLSPLHREGGSSVDGSAKTPIDINSIGNIYSPLKDIESAPSPLRYKRRRTDDLKVEGPLTPPMSDQPPPWERKNASINDILQETMPDMDLLVTEPESTSLDDIDKLFAEQIAPIAAKAEQAIEQERLQEADTTCRVPVPILDFSEPKPPWEVFSSMNIHERQKEFLLHMKETHLDCPPWRLDGHIMRGLSWTPFPSSFGRFELQESIEDDGSLAAFIAQPDVVDPEALSWNPPGLRFLDNLWDSDEEELECGEFPEAKDVQSLIKERNFELQDEEDGDPATDVEKMQSTDPFTRKRIHLGNGPSRQRRDQQEKQIESSAVAPDFSAMGALDEFLGVRKGELIQKRQLGEHHYATKPTASEERHRQQEPSESQSTQKRALTALVPQFNLPNTPRFFVASTTFLANRKLVRQLRDLYPSAELIERDFALYNLPGNVQPQLVRPTYSVSSSEADLILSPSTGLVITSLQKIKQQALPGQVTRSPIRERLQQVAARYERLVIIVDRTASATDIGASLIGYLDENDCEALASLTAFLNHLPCLSESELLLIDGDTSNLATWIVSLMVKYSPEAAVGLLQEETQWEVFLRHLGMNAFAAQFVLAELKAMQERDGKIWGLREFILMESEERCRGFEVLLGSRGILERVGQVLDARW